MLQIYTDGQLTDLSDDISIDLTFENPLFSTDRIPAAYSLSYDLPLTPRNKTIFGNPDRVTAAGDRFRDHPTRILFDGIEIASGIQTIEEVGEAITVNFSGSILPPAINRHLQNVEMDTFDLAGYNSNHYTAEIVWDGTLRRNMKDPDAAFFAPPIAIKDVEQLERDPDNPQDLLLNTRSRWLNPMHMQAQSYLHFLKTGNWQYMLKVIPAVRVWYIFDKIFGGKLEHNIFKDGEWKKLSLQCLWHPNYNLTDNWPCWNAVSPSANPNNPGPDITVRLQDFMPDVSAADFVVEMLKLPCASMYIKGDTFSIESNADILNRKIVRDIRPDQLIGTPTITKEAGQEYAVGYASGDEGEQPEGEIKDVDTILDGLHYMAGRGNLTDGTGVVTSVKVKNPPQVLTAILNDTGGRTPYALKQEDMPATETSDDTTEEDDSGSYDMTVNAKVVRCVANRYWLNDDDMNHYGNWGDKILCPEIEALGTKRGDEMLIGLWQGMQSEIRQWYSQGQSYNSYPYLSATNYGANGERLGDLSLYWNGEDGLAKRHKKFCDWISKDKVVLTVLILLSALELHNLDLRDKFAVLGRHFFMRSLRVSLKKLRIEPAEADLVES